MKKALEFLVKLILLPVYLIAKLLSGVPSLYEKEQPEAENTLLDIRYAMDETDYKISAISGKLSKMDENINILKKYTSPDAAEARFAKLENKLAKLENTIKQAKPEQKPNIEIKHHGQKR
jgi:DNA repair ATPase RecN